MTEYFIKKLNTSEKLLDVKELSVLKRVENATTTDEIEYSWSKMDLGSFEYVFEKVSLLFNGYCKALECIFPHLHNSEIKSLISLFHFYKKVFPFTTVNNPDGVCKVEINSQNKEITINIDLFSIKYNGKDYSILFKYELKPNYNKMKDIEFTSINKAFLNLFSRSFNLFYDETITKCNNDTFLRVLETRDIHGYLKIKLSPYLNYEKDIDYAKRLKLINNIEVCNTFADKRHFDKSKSFVFGDSRIKKNILNIAKLSKSEILFAPSRIDIIDIMLNGILNTEDLINIKLIISLIIKHKKAFYNNDNIRIIVSKNNWDKKSIKSLQQKIDLITISVHGNVFSKIVIGKEINIEINEKKKINKSCQNLTDTANIVLYETRKEIADELSINPEEVNDSHYQLVSMINC